MLCSWYGCNCTSIFMEVFYCREHAKVGTFYMKLYIRTFETLMFLQCD